MPVHQLLQLMGPQSGSHLCYPAKTNITQVPHSHIHSHRQHIYMAFNAHGHEAIFPKINTS